MPGATVGPILPPPATYHASPRRHRGGLASCCCGLCSLLLIFLFLVGSAILILWLVLRPVHLPKYTFDNVTISNFTVVSNSTSLTGNFVYTLTANNPNRRIGIYYDIINVDTSYDGNVLGRSVVGRFYQGHWNVTTMTTPELNVENYPLTASEATILEREIRENSVPIHVRGDAQVRVKIGAYKSPDFWVRVNCDVVVGVNPSALISKSCKLTRRS